MGGNTTIGRVLSNDTIVELQKRGAKYMQRLEDNGVIKFENGQYVAAKEGVFKEKDLAPVGTTVERTSDPNAPKPATTTTVTTSIAQFTDAEGKIDPMLALFITGLVNYSDASGNVTLRPNVTIEQFENAIKQYLESKPAGDVPTVEFLQNSDPEWINELVKEGAVKKEDDGTYTVADRAKLNSMVRYPGADMPPETEVGEVTLAFTKTTTTEQPKNVTVPDGLDGDKQKQKALKAEYAGKIREWMQKPENELVKEVSMANMFYGKKVDAEMANLKKQYHSDAAMVKAYIEKYRPDAKDLLNKANELLKNDTRSAADYAKAYNKIKPEDEAPMAEADFEIAGKSGEALAKAYNARLSVILSAMGELDPELSPKNIERIFATKNVLNARNHEQMLEDNKRFVEEQAERHVRANVAEEVFNKTVVHWDESGKKAANSSDPEKRHTALSKGGREFVMKNAVKFGIPVEYKEDLQEGKDYDYSSTYTDPTTGESKVAFYKFNSDAFKQYMREAADSRTDVDNYDEDFNSTVNERRQAGVQRNSLVGDDLERTSYEMIRGNADGVMNFRENHKFRKDQKRAGLDTEKDKTWQKRALYVAGEGAKQAAVAFLTGGLGSVAAGALKVAPEALTWATDPKIVTVDGQTVLIPGQDYDESFWDTVKMKINGTEYSNTNYYEVKGTTPDRWIEIPGKDLYIDGESGEVISKGGSDNTYLRTGLYAAGIGAGLGIVTGLLNMNKMNADGTYWDGIVKLEEAPIPPEVETTNKTVNYTHQIPIEVRDDGKLQGADIQVLRNKKGQGPYAYSTLYQYEDGTPVNPKDFAKAYQQKIGGSMSENGFFLFTDLKINGKRIVPLEGKALQQAYDKIPDIKPTGQRGIDYNAEAKKELYIGVKIKG